MTGEDEHLSLDRISALPQPIIETILCLLSTKEAARTSILSRDWRYHWTKIPKIDLDLYDLFGILEKKQVQEESFGSELYHELLQILLLHQGLIQEFSLSFDKYYYNCFGLDKIILHLLKNHRVKKLTLKDYVEWDALPMSIFSLPHLTHLHLDTTYFKFKGEQTFDRLLSFTSLHLYGIATPSENLLQLFSNCPSLKELLLCVFGQCVYGQCVFGADEGETECNIVQLFESLPMIQHFTLYRCDLMGYFSVMESLPHKLPVLFNLEYFYFIDDYFEDGYGLTCLLHLIKCAPNLKKLELELDWNCRSEYEDYPIFWEEYSDVWLEHLNVLKINYYKNTKLEMEFLRFILAKSPKLNIVYIISDPDCYELDQEPEMLEFLSQVPRSLSQIIKYKHNMSGSVFRDL